MGLMGRGGEIFRSMYGGFVVRWEVFRCEWWVVDAFEWRIHRFTFCVSPSEIFCLSKKLPVHSSCKR